MSCHVDVRKKNLLQGSCNFCDRGKWDNDEMKANYPYSKVYHITGRSVSVRACQSCWNEIKKQVNDQH